MLVINGDRRRIPPTEKIVLDWLRSWNDTFTIGGVAISGCQIPDRRPGHHHTTEADLVIITPRFWVVVEVKGLVKSGVGGEMVCPANGRWSLPSIPDRSPVYVRQGDTNPLDQVSDSTFNLKALAERTNIGKPFVLGLVLVMPWPGHTLTIAASTLPQGINVEVGTLSGLRSWFHQHAKGRPCVWNAEQVYALLGALNFADAVTQAELAAEGFASDAPPSAVVRSLRSSPLNKPWPDHEDTHIVQSSVFDDPIPPNPARAPRRRLTQPWRPSEDIPAVTRRQNDPTFTYGFDYESPTPPPFIPSSRGNRSRRSRPRARGRSGRSAVQGFSTLLMLLLIGSGLWLFVHHSDRATPHNTGTTIQTSQSAAATPQRPNTAPAEQSTPPGPKTCYPFQPNC
ncbi:nuclease-related domain-containing protein [Nocardia sp. NPDC059240]|uniref:nuclease-related domain-containing protein n=1 Tax=Nocardia sp. NPDC059240 TaxID=3346786 RepID=UPI0036D0938F